MSKRGQPGDKQGKRAGLAHRAASRAPGSAVIGPLIQR